mmetsp:Transcript_6852/g.25899  ORF Transcript_6852/g.25899 Transcript_6852/m.25899 type:complete len:200 (-) Transcript_6852:161-760(-)
MTSSQFGPSAATSALCRVVSGVSHVHTAPDSSHAIMCFRPTAMAVTLCAVNVNGVGVRVAVVLGVWGTPHSNRTPSFAIRNPHSAPIANFASGFQARRMIARHDVAQKGTPFRRICAASYLPTCSTSIGRNARVQTCDASSARPGRQRANSTDARSMGSKHPWAVATTTATRSASPTSTADAICPLWASLIPANVSETS